MFDRVLDTLLIVNCKTLSTTKVKNKYIASDPVLSFSLLGIVVFESSIFNTVLEIVNK